MEKHNRDVDATIDWLERVNVHTVEAWLANWSNVILAPSYRRKITTGGKYFVWMNTENGMFYENGIEHDAGMILCGSKKFSYR